MTALAISLKSALFSACRSAEKADDLRDILRLIADALHIGNHFQRGGDLPQIPRHRLLLQQQLQAQVLDFPLLLVDLAVQRR